MNGMGVKWYDEDDDNEDDARVKLRGS